MGFSSFIAIRHVFAHKSHSAVNIISIIAMGGVMISTASLIVVLSVFNGIESIIRPMYSSLDTDLAITPTKGKWFYYSDSLRNTIEQNPYIETVGCVLQEDALFGYRDQQQIGLLTGVDNNYLSITKLPNFTKDGQFKLHLGTMPIANVGAGIAYYLRISIDMPTPITLYLPNRTASDWLNPTTAFRQKNVSLGAILSVNADFDEASVVIPIETAHEMLNLPHGFVSKLVLQLKKNASSHKAQHYLQDAIGHNFTVLNRQQQNEALYRTMKSERFIIIVILSLILFIATFNIVGSLSMLIIDKRDDIDTLASLGAQTSQIRNIFLLEGSIISFGGASLGILLGLVLCWAQSSFGLIALGKGSGFVVATYPVEIHQLDILFVLLLAGCLGILASWIPARLIKPLGRNENQ